MIPTNSATPLAALAGGLGLGGSTTFLLNLGRAFRERGFALPIVCLTEEHPMAGDFTAAGVRVQTFSRRKFIYEDRIRLAYEQLAATRPTAVLACLGSESFEVLRMLPEQVVRLGIIQSDDPPPYEMTRHYARWLDGMVGVSETIAQRLRADPAFAGKRIECIPYGIQFGPAQARPPREPGSPLRIIYVGRMIETQKRISRVVELARMLAGRGDAFELILAGTGPELESSKAALKGMPQVRFLGSVANAEVGGLLRSQDVLILLSDFEGLPLSLLEAMGEGVVPVISDLESGIREVVTNETGVRVPVGDVPAAAAAIGQLARDSARLAALSAAASEFARGHYSAVRMAGRYLELIGSLARPGAMWPARMRVRTPLLLRHPWLYQGTPRHARRVWKRLTGV